MQCVVPALEERCIEHWQRANTTYIIERIHKFVTKIDEQGGTCCCSFIKHRIAIPRKSTAVGTGGCCVVHSTAPWLTCPTEWTHLRLTICIRSGLGLTTTVEWLIVPNAISASWRSTLSPAWKSTSFDSSAWKVSNFIVWFSCKPHLSLCYCRAVNSDWFHLHGQKALRIPNSDSNW